MMRLLQRVVLMTLFLVAATVGVSKAQNVFRIRFDTVKANAGDTVTVNVYYTLTSTHAHTINYFQARFSYDTTEIYPVEYDLAGTASGMLFDTTISHIGITARGQSEIDTTNPVLFRIRFRVNRQLADTAFLRWDSSFVLFDASENVDRVITQDGWVRTATTAGRVVMTSPQTVVRGETEGYSPDSVAFQLPILVSNIEAARMQTAVLSFTYDSTVLSLQGAVAGSASGAVPDSISTTALMGGRRAVRIAMHAPSDIITGGDTLIKLAFVGLVGLDTVCQQLADVLLRPTNSNAYMGNTTYSGGSVCLEGTFPSSVVSQQTVSVAMGLYPNPATSTVRIELNGFGDGSTIALYDMLGREIYRWNGETVVWQVPANVQPGVYQVVATDTRGERIAHALVLER